MRSKEVEKAIDVLNKGVYNANIFGSNSMITLTPKVLQIILNYISELEEKSKKCEYYEGVADTLYKNSVNKDTIRELKGKVHKTLDANGITRAYQIFIDKDFDELLGE